MTTARKRLQQHQGFALIEVLVSLVIFSLGVVGLIGVQARALQVSTDAQDRSTAALLAQSLSSEMWVVRSTSLSDSAVNAWKAQIKDALPRGEGEVTQNTAGTDATISIKWLANSRKVADKSSGKTDGEAKSQFITQVVIPQ
ncbi:MAG: prepilin-type N-terminal cleavage/methylation domain-containing protein [Comamonas sp.]